MIDGEWDSRAGGGQGNYEGSKSMSEYIKREDAIGALLDKYVDYAGLVDSIESVPSADVVEVVRCKDCKYYREYVSNRGSALMCFCPCCISGQGKKKPTDYCSYGERKDGDNGA